MPILAKNSSIAEASRAVAEHEQRLRFEDYEPGALRVGEKGLVLEDDDFVLDHNGFRRLCKAVGAPASYLEELPESLQERLLNHHLASERRGGTLILYGDHVLALDRSDLVRLQGAEVIDAVGEAVGDATVHDLSVNGNALRLEILGARLSEEVVEGDVVRGGLQIEHSLLGEWPTTIRSFVLRLLCTNGMTHRDCLGRKRAPRVRRLPSHQENARSLQLEQVKRLAQESWSGLEQKLEAIKGLTEERVDDPERVWGQFLGRVRMGSQRVIELLRRAWREEGSEPTSYGVFNALTRAATHYSEELSHEQRRALSGVAGVFANRSIHICPRCFSLVGRENLPL